MNPGARVQERDNLITPVRLALALTVAVWHAFAIAAPDAGFYTEPGIKGLSPSYLAVNGFFILSGFLIAKSAASGDWVRYAVSRLLRLYPALIALMAAGTLFAILLHLGRPDMPSGPGSWQYPLRSLLFANAANGFPGLFAENPRGEFALSLWTLRYEAAAYLALPVAVVLGLVKTPLRAWGLWAALAVLFGALTPHPDAPDLLYEGARLGSAFVLGAAIFTSRAWLGWLLRVETLVIALGAAGLLYSTYLFEDAADLILAWALFNLCLRPATGLAAPLARAPDWSYGLYIWHWPVYQTLKMAFPGAGPGLLLTLGLAVSLALAAASWTFVEKPALARKGQVTDWARRMLDRAKAGRRPAGQTAAKTARTA